MEILVDILMHPDAYAAGVGVAVLLWAKENPGTTAAICLLLGYIVKHTENKVDDAILEKVKKKLGILP